MVEIKEIDIPINADVQCKDGTCGTSTCVILNPITRRITHLVVRERGRQGLERLVPIRYVAESTSQSIHLACTKDELAKAEPFIEKRYLREKTSEISYAATGYMLLPYAVPRETMTLVEEEQIPPHELAIHRGARVKATDGQLGQVDEFLINPITQHITHLVLREGSLWAQREVTIPVSAIDRIVEDQVYLKLSKAEIDTLPTIPMRRG